MDPLTRQSRIGTTPERIAWHAITLVVLALLLGVLLVSVRSLDEAGRRAPSPGPERARAPAEAPADGAPRRGVRPGSRSGADPGATPILDGRAGWRSCRPGPCAAV